MAAVRVQLHNWRGCSGEFNKKGDCPPGVARARERLKNLLRCNTYKLCTINGANKGNRYLDSVGFTCVNITPSLSVCGQLKSVRG